MLGGGGIDRTKDTEFSFYNSAACEKICKKENISVAKFLYKKLKRWFERNGAKIFSQRLNWPAKVC